MQNNLSITTTDSSFQRVAQTMQQEVDRILDRAQVYLEGEGEPREALFDIDEAIQNAAEANRCDTNLDEVVRIYPHVSPVPKPEPVVEPLVGALKEFGVATAHYLEGVLHEYASRVRAWDERRREGAMTCEINVNYSTNHPEGVAMYASEPVLNYEVPTHVTVAPLAVEDYHADHSFEQDRRLRYRVEAVIPANLPTDYADDLQYESAVPLENLIPTARFATPEVVLTQAPVEVGGEESDMRHGFDAEYEPVRDESRVRNLHVALATLSFLYQQFRR